MDAETGAIVAITVVEKRHVQGKSPNMEREGLRQALNDLKKRGIKVKRVITDAHAAIAKMIRKHTAHFYFFKLHLANCSNKHF